MNQTSIISTNTAEEVPLPVPVPVPITNYDSNDNNILQNVNDRMTKCCRFVCK